MNAILAGLREFALYGLIWSLLGKNILFAIIAIGLYLLFMLFTWLKAKHLITTSVTVVRGVATENYADIFINLNYAGIARFAIAVKQDYKYIVSVMESERKKRDSGSMGRYRQW